MNQPELQTDPNCIFCKLSNKEIPSHQIAETEHFLAILDKFPATKGHTVIIPKKHIPISPLLPNELTTDLAEIIKKVGKTIIDNLSTSYSIFIANGAIAGQKVPHLILHVIPRYNNDNVTLNPKRSNKKGYEEIHKKLIERLGSKTNSDILLQDDDLTILHPKDNFVNGEIKIFVNEQKIILEQVETKILAKMIQISNKLATILFETLNFPATNILIQNGDLAGQTESYFSINILPRQENDEINLIWEPKEAKEEDLKQIIEGIQNQKTKKEQEEYLKKKSESITNTNKEPTKKEETKNDEPSENYLTRSLNRLP